jgi:hypothetical protein
LEKLDKPIYSVKGHGEIINAIDAVGGLGIGEGAPEIGTASRDGTWIERFRFIAFSCCFSLQEKCTYGIRDKPICQWRAWNLLKEKRNAIVGLFALAMHSAAVIV